MNPDIEARILAAQSPDSLKRAVIDALRELWDAVERQPADPWATGWETGGYGAGKTERSRQWASEQRAAGHTVIETKPGERYRSEEEANAARLAARIAANPALGKHIEAVETLMATATGEDFEALKSKLNLLKEGGAEPEQLIEEGARPVIQSDGTTGIVDFTAVSMERKAARYQWAMEHNLHEFLAPGWNPEHAAETFAKGGPMWLYLDEGGRDAILAMPPAWRAWLIQEVELDSPAEAQIMGRDIMKQEDALDPDNSPAGQAARHRANEAFGG